MMSANAPEGNKYRFFITNFLIWGILPLMALSDGSVPSLFMIRNETDQEAGQGLSF